MSLFSQIVVSASDQENAPFAVWDLHTGTQLASFKGNASETNCVCHLGNDYVVAAQSSKDALHFWTWHKEAVVLKSFVAEKITALAASPSGAFVAGGGASGTLYYWAASTGRLLLNHKAHYKAIQCVKFTDGGSMVVTGGDDAAVNVWSTVELLDATAPQHHSHAPRWSWSQHTLPVTSLSVGAGEADPYVVSASLDQTCRVWSVASGACIRTLLLPAALHCVALHWTEQHLFAGAADGKIYQAAVPLAAAGGGGVASGASAAAAAIDHTAMQGHTQAVTCLALSTDGQLLVSGSRDGSVRVWDTATRQQLRMIQQPCHTPVTGLLVRVRPAYLHVTGSRSQKGDSASQAVAKPQRPAPLAHFAKYPGAGVGGRPWEDGLTIVLDGSQAYGDVVGRSGLLAFCEQMIDGADVESGGEDGARLGVGVMAARITELESELAEWKSKYTELFRQTVSAEPRQALG